MEKLIRFLKIKIFIESDTIPKLTRVERYIIDVMLSSSRVHNADDCLTDYYKSTKFDVDFAKTQKRDDGTAIWFNVYFTTYLMNKYKLKIWEVEYILYNLFINKFKYGGHLIIYCLDNDKGWV